MVKLKKLGLWLKLLLVFCFLINFAKRVNSHFTSNLQFHPGTGHPSIVIFHV